MEGTEASLMNSDLENFDLQWFFEGGDYYSPPA